MYDISSLVFDSFNKDNVFIGEVDRNHRCVARFNSDERNLTYQPNEVDWLIDGCSQEYLFRPMEINTHSNLEARCSTTYTYQNQTIILFRLDLPNGLSYSPLLKSLYVAKMIACLSCANPKAILWLKCKQIDAEIYQNLLFICWWLWWTLNIHHNRLVTVMWLWFGKNIVHDLFVAAKNRSRNHFISRTERIYGPCAVEACYLE